MPADDVTSDGSDWREGAACRSATVDFFDEGAEHEAVAVCRTCPALRPCREFALAEGPPEGVWGGLTPRDRRVLVLRARGDRRSARLSRPPASR